MFGCHGRGASGNIVLLIVVLCMDVCVFTSQCKTNGSGEIGKKWVLVSECSSAYLVTVSQAIRGVCYLFFVD